LKKAAGVMRPTIDGILLAAGESRRMGFPKPLLRIGNDTFLTRALHSMLEVARAVVVVTGAYEQPVRDGVSASRRLRIVHNPDFQRGQLSSLKCAIGATSPDVDGVMVHLADHPLVQGATFRALAEKYEVTRAPILIACHHGRRGHPVLFAKGVFSELLAAPEGEGARFVVNADPARVVYVEVEDPGVTLDLDTPEDLKRAGLAPPPADRRGGSARNG
jgi:molybdenum cofactor cytidylyltransferase